MLSFSLFGGVVVLLVGCGFLPHDPSDKWKVPPYDPETRRNGHPKKDKSPPKLRFVPKDEMLVKKEDEYQPIGPCGYGC